MDRARRFLLALCLMLLAIPGIKGIDLHIAGFHVGRFQPFKFAFVGWIACQAAWVFLNRRSSKTPIGHDRLDRSLLLVLGALDLILLLALIIEGGGPHGGAVWVSFLLGQLAAFVTWKDPAFPVKEAGLGIAGATAILFAFALIEFFFPQSGFVHWVISSVRDNSESYFGRIQDGGWGSTLTISGLSEFTIRTLPIALFVPISSARTRAIFVGTIAALSLATLEKSSLLALIAMVAFAATFIATRKTRRKLLASFAILLGAITLLIGPKRIYDRYFGMFSASTENTPASIARSSINLRLLQWKAAGHVLEVKPWLGLGLDGLAHRIGNRIPPLHERYGGMPGHAHNLFLEMGVSGGWVALLLFVGVWALYFARAYVARPRNWAALIYLVGQCVVMMTDARIYVSWLGITYFWLPAIAFAVGRRKAVV